ncbi:class I SAM-dependent methyltransferase [Gynurincola endophyticus]|uniref:class I SAM-dependent methyltransferase n=1 Tax=Gynurincola endophyticus TaxID=2479004 RepID=UPI0018F61B7E|nr:class I SAM-dependent methyltransferase [Gynurincola endophyticus]
MELQDAINLIDFSDKMKFSKAMQWADLGCGSGLFTTALSYLLPVKSHVKGVDKELQRFFDEPRPGVSLDFLKADFQKDRLLLPPLDGLLMANSLHYVKDKQVLLQKLRQHLKPQHHWLIVEYDTQVPNPWVPYPIQFNALKELFLEMNYSEIHYLRHISSRYGHGNIYACIISSSNL